MDKKKIYERLYTIVLTAVFLGLVWLGLWALKVIAVLSFVALVTSAIVGFLTIKNFDTFKNGEDAKLVISAMLYVSLISGAFIWFGNHKDSAIIEGILIDGKISRHEYILENDEGPGVQEKTYYRLIPSNDENKNYVEIIDWVLIILSVFVQVLSVKNLNKVDDLNQQQKFKRKYPNWKGEIPILKE